MKKIILMSLLCANVYVHGMDKKLEELLRYHNPAQYGMWINVDGPAHCHNHGRFELIAEKVNLSQPGLQMGEIMLHGFETGSIRFPIINDVVNVADKVLDEDATIAAAIQAVRSTRDFAESNVRETTVDVSLLLVEIEQDEKRIAYNKLFDACKQGSITAIDEFVANNPTANLNYQNEHGTTPLLYAATWNKWDAVWHLVKCGADLKIKDNYGQTLFSKAVYSVWGPYAFKKLLNYFSLDEINRACKTICLERKMSNPARLDLNDENKKILYGLEDKNNINNPMVDSQTILHIACIYKKIPLIIKLLEHGAQCDIKNKWKKTAYDELKSECHHKRASLFVVREAFNIDLGKSMFFINSLLAAHVDGDTARHIKQLYVNAQCESPKARIWKPVCVDVCKMLNVDVTDEKRCLVTVMLLSQHTLTEMNVRLALEDK